MKKILILGIIFTTFTACSSLKTMNSEHTAQRKELRKEQTIAKKELGTEHKAESKALSEKNKKQRELLKAKHSIQFAVVGTQKYLELQKLEAFLK
ncbi:MAG: hypothetical protein ACRCZ2_11770 [Fusobacteriaceae bacterium]